MGGARAGARARGGGGGGSGFGLNELMNIFALSRYECSFYFTTLRSEHAQSMGDGVDALGVRSVASRLRVRGHARAVGRRALRPPIRVHQILGPRSEVDAWMAKGGIIGDFGQAPERQRRLSSAPKRRGLSSRGQRAALSERRGLSSGGWPRKQL